VHDSKTIEGDVFEALTKAGAVSADNATDHRKVDVARAARTDAGVHAAGNV
jgi:tRNA pseudouridine38-40 synthase